MALNSTLIVLSDSDDERVSEGWFPKMEGSRAYKDAMLVLRRENIANIKGNHWMSLLCRQYDRHRHLEEIQ